MVCFVYQHANMLLVDFNHTTTNSKVFELVVGVALLVANGQRTWLRKCHNWLVTREHRNITSCRWCHQLINLAVELDSEQGYEFDCHTSH